MKLVITNSIIQYQSKNPKSYPLTPILNQVNNLHRLWESFSYTDNAFRRI